MCIRDSLIIILCDWYTIAVTVYIYFLCYITNLSTILNFCNFTGCKCNKLGSLNGMCDSRRYCFCKPQYIGKRCDQCKAGFGNFPKCTGFYTLLIFRIFFLLTFFLLFLQCFSWIKVWNSTKKVAISQIESCWVVN